MNLALNNRLFFQSIILLIIKLDNKIIIIDFKVLILFIYFLLLVI